MPDVAGLSFLMELNLEGHRNSNCSKSLCDDRNPNIIEQSQQATSHRPNVAWHMSLYSLWVESGFYIYKWLKTGRLGGLVC